MESKLQEIRDAQKASWDKFSPGWQKWDDLVMGFLKPHGDAIIAAIKPEGSNYILDVAAGTGEPGLTIAPMLKGGKVLVTDLSDGMLKVAADKAAARGLKNLETKIADACALPFEDNTFDKVSCRLGLMFVPDMLLAIKEMTRVLKPGGKFATTVWAGPENNFWVTCMMQNIKKHMDVPAPEPGAPGMFRCAERGLIAGLCKQAGLKDVSEKEVPGRMATENGQHYWTFMTDVAAPFVAVLSKADDATREKIHQDVVRSMDEKCPGGGIDTLGLVISGTKG